MRVREIRSNEVTPQRFPRFSSCSDIHVIERYPTELVRRYAHLLTDLVGRAPDILLYGLRAIPGSLRMNVTNFL